MRGGPLFLAVALAVSSGCPENGADDIGAQINRAASETLRVSDTGGAALPDAGLENYSGRFVCPECLVEFDSPGTCPYDNSPLRKKSANGK